MPIKPENRDRYPANWATEIRPSILERARNRCEWCGKPNREEVWVNDEGSWKNWPCGVMWIKPNGIPPIPDRYPAVQWRAVKGPSTSGFKTVKVVLTIAHMDHVPEHCEPDNLRALCQRCHLNYDACHHAKSAAATRRAQLEQDGQGRLLS